MDLFNFNVALIVTNIIATNNKLGSIIALIILTEKNFGGLRKLQVLGDFLIEKPNYLVTFIVILLLFMHMKQLYD